ncbi:MAG: hypothetical protein QM627_04870, partial [Luteolibacter sp.]
MNPSSDKVLVIRTCDVNLRSYGNFQWPESGPVKAPDWNPEPVCGGGLHGLLWGKGDYGLLSSDFLAKWMVVEVEKDSVVDLGDKVKFPEGNVIFVGSSADALKILREGNWGVQEKPEATTSGDGAHSTTSGDGAHSTTSGDGAHSTTSGR